MHYASLTLYFRVTSAHFTGVRWPPWPRHTIPRNTINQELLQPQGELYPSQPIFNHRNRNQRLEFCTSFYETISSASEFLAQGIFQAPKFYAVSGNHNGITVSQRL